jgi:hypothetical protein
MSDERSARARLSVTGAPMPAPSARGVRRIRPRQRCALRRRRRMHAACSAAAAATAAGAAQRSARRHGARALRRARIERAQRAIVMSVAVSLAQRTISRTQEAP